MIKKPSQMKSEQKTELRGGTGTVEMQHLVDEQELNHARLFCRFFVPEGASLGTHEHHDETEYYYILSGSGAVDEGAGEIEVGPGDMVITGGGAQHSIRNSGSGPLEFIAVIILDD